MKHVVLGTAIYKPFPDGMETISFGAGCFWGVEKLFWQQPGVYTTAVGYQGGGDPNPTYEQVCTGTTNHAEVVLVVFDPAKTSAHSLLQTFWENHDPTQLDRQGNDVGSQYRSCVFPTTQQQYDDALQTKTLFQTKLTAAGYGEITTVIATPQQTAAFPFFYAEDYHQGYLAKNPTGYCPIHATGITCN